MTTKNMLFVFIFTSCATTPVVNINSASQETLETLPGVDEVTSFRIVHRRQHHPYRAIDDLVTAGIPSATVDRLRPYLTVSAPTTWKIPPKTVTESSPPAAPESTEYTH